LPSTGAEIPGTVSLSVHCHSDHVGHVPVGQLGALAAVYWAIHSEVSASVEECFEPSCSLIRWPL
jgi:hypothetical protein